MLKQYWDSFIIALLAFEAWWIVDLNFIEGLPFDWNNIVVNTLVGGVAAASVVWLYGGIKSWMKS